MCTGHTAMTLMSSTLLNETAMEIYCQNEIQNVSRTILLLVDLYHEHFVIN